MTRVMSRFNKPLGMRLDNFSPEARLVLRLGHKFALERKLQASLMALTNATMSSFSREFAALSNDEEKQGLDAWVQAMTHDIKGIREPKVSKIDILISKGMRDLAKLPVVLKQADKNLGLVPIHRHIYEMMCREHLEDPKIYQRVPLFPVESVRDKMRVLLLRPRSPIARWKAEKWTERSKAANEPAAFYVIPKIHKKKMFASRPIAAQHSYILAPLSKELSDVLLSVQFEFPTIARDSKTTAYELENFTFSRPGVFLTYDVVAMYPNIDLQDAMNVLERNCPVLSEDGGFWGKALRLVMFNCFVSFNGETYHQIKGTAMGTPVAPPFANLYFYYKYLEVLEDEKILFQRRFIDDGFVIIESAEDARKLMMRMSNIGKLEFTYEISSETAIFLDFHIYRGPRYASVRKLDFKPYFKPTNQFLYLPEKSNHPQHMKLGLVKGEAIRCLRNSTRKEEWLQAMHTIFKGLIARGYDGAAIKDKFRTVRWEDRLHYLEPSEKQDSRPDGKLVLAPYHRHTKPVWHKLLAKHNLTRRLRPKGFRYTKKQQTIVDAWPPVVVFENFLKIGHCVIRARQDSRQVGTDASGLTTPSRVGPSAYQDTPPTHARASDRHP